MNYTQNVLGANVGLTACFNGALQDIRFYTRPLSVQDINALWKYGVLQQASSNNNIVIDLSSAIVQYYYPNEILPSVTNTNVAVLDLVTNNGLFNVPQLYNSYLAEYNSGGGNGGSNYNCVYCQQYPNITITKVT